MACLAAIGRRAEFVVARVSAGGGKTAMHAQSNTLTRRITDHGFRSAWSVHVGRNGADRLPQLLAHHLKLSQRALR